MSQATSHPPGTPMDVRLGLTRPEDVAYPLRWGILGTGSISSQWAMALHGCAGATVAAVAARDPGRAGAFAETHRIPVVHASYADLVNAADIDIIYVGTIVGLHHEHTLLAIEAGKHVLCEKPLATTSSHARAMYAAAEARGVMLQDGMWTRFFPAVEHARAVMEAGTIGDIGLVMSDFFDPIYAIQAAPLAFGSDAVPTAITTAGGAARAAIVEYDADRTAVLTFPPNDCELPEITEFVGTKGRITLERPGHCPTTVSIRVPPPGGVPSLYETDNAPAPVERHEYPLPGGVSISGGFPNQHGFLYQAEAIHRCLAAGLPQCPQYDKAASLHAMDLLTEIDGSAPT